MDENTYENPVLDLRYAHKVLNRGDIAAVLTWNRHTEQGCLVLLPVNVKDPRNVVPCIISEGDAWIWSDVIGDYMEQEQRAMLYAAALQLPPDKKSIFRVIGIIQDLVGEFGFMPPMPSDDEKVVADIVAIDQDGKESHSEVREHV